MQPNEPAQENIYKHLNSITQFSDDENDMILYFADDKIDEKSLTLKVLDATRIEVEGAITKLFIGITLNPEMLKSFIDFLIYIRVRGTKYSRIIKVINVFGGDTLIREEENLLKSSTFRISTIYLMKIKCGRRLMIS